MDTNIKDGLTIEITKGTKKESPLEDNILYWVLSLLIFLCGSLGIIISISTTLALTYNQFLVYSEITLIVIGIWFFCNEKGKKLRYLILFWGGLSVISLGYVLQQLPYFLYGFVAQVYKIYGIHLSSVKNITGDTTVVLLVIAPLLIFILYYLIFQKNKKSIIFLSSFIVLLFAVLLERNPTLFNLGLLIVFNVGLTTLIRNCNGKQISVINNTYAQTSSSLVLVVLSICMLLASYGITSSRMDAMLINVNAWGKQILYTIVPNLEFQSLASVDVSLDNGHINRGGIIRTNRTDLQVTTKKKPKETIYLKGYIGGVYEGERWAEIEENQFFKSTYKEVFSRKWNMYTQKSYYLLNPNEVSHDDETEIEIKKLRKRDKETYAPYIGRFNRTYDETYSFYYFEQADFDALYQGPETSAENLNMELDYQKYVTENYLQIPEERIPRIKALCEENPFTDVKDITNFIKSTLDTNTKYTLRPTTIPPDEEITEYFLFESKEGYCVHYASTAGLMYRLYGIPARYVTGYVAFPEDFTITEDKDYQTKITDKAAHAWVEIYDPEIGWKPIEVTPASEVWGNTDVATTNPNINRPDTSTNTPNTTEPSNQETPKQTPKEQTGIDIISEYKVLFITLGAILLGVLIIVIRRIIVLYRMKKEAPRKIFKKMITLLNTTITMRKYTGLEEDFVDTLISTCSDIKRHDAKHMMDILYQEAYGKKSASIEEQQLIYAIYTKVYKKCTILMNRKQYWYYKYIDIHF